MDKTLNKDIKELQDEKNTNKTKILLKYEIAEELGLLDKIFQKGWKNLTAKESGKIGGLVKSKKDKNKNEE